LDAQRLRLAVKVELEKGGFQPQRCQTEEAEGTTSPLPTEKKGLPSKPPQQPRAGGGGRRRRARRISTPTEREDLYPSSARDKEPLKKRENTLATTPLSLLLAATAGQQGREKQD
jgi:hypothetical protein